MNLQKIRFTDHTAASEKAITRDHQIIAVREEAVEPATVQVCMEDAFILALNGKPIATQKLTPAELECFALGFLVCEGLVSDPSCIAAVEIDPPSILVEADTCSCEGQDISLEVRSAGIGVAQRQGISGSPLREGITIDKEVLFEGTRQMHEIAAVWRSTGGTHCTILVDAGGQVRSAAEDIGRHNSVDKAVGKALLSGVKPDECFMVCTGRLPADMVAKAYHAGISIVVSNNAPFSSGISLAEETNITLVGFARQPRMSIYAHPGRIRL
ncbi:MAG: formate dehydrogenase accessory sulfurtransferase FdhD [Methanomicrobiaceae archaeon]|uniref:Formate dehydrogenase chain d n=1 Tax=hydrocarbon metagenome TaxID=938273 RepID=A0A0W8FGS8_9ZZZZ|nr:formate dehydrogenase accessory sulfurtransferase FdhD [Methanomicrobiaceae archaeon]